MARLVSETPLYRKVSDHLGNKRLPYTVFFHLQDKDDDWPTPDFLEWIRNHYPTLSTNVQYHEFNQAIKGDDVDFEIHSSSFLYFVQFKDPKIAAHFKLSFQ